MLFKKHKRFEKSFKKLSPKLQNKLGDVLKLYIEDSRNPQLNNHALKGKFLGLLSLNLTGDYRIIYRKSSSRTIEIIELVQVGTHSELYK